MYSIQQGEKWLNFTNVDEQAPTSSHSLTPVPLEIYLRIFQEITSFRDFCSLALSNKFLYSIAVSQKLQAANCPELVPYYFKHHAQPALDQLPVCKKIALAAQIENTLVSSEAREPMFQRKIDLKRHCVFFDQHIITTMIGDHLVYSLPRDPSGVIHVYHIKTGSYRSLAMDNLPIFTCTAIHVPCPLLITTHLSDGFKIWNFEHLLKSDNAKQALLLHKAKSISSSRFNHVSDQLETTSSPVITVSNHLLGVGYSKYVHIFDSHHLFETPLLIRFANVRQIEFFEDHLMLVSHNEIAIWPLSAILTVLEQQADEKVLSLESARFKYTDTNRNAEMTFAKVHQEKVVIAYTFGYRLEDEKRNNLMYFKIGEVRNWKTGQAIRPLAHPCDLSCTSEFKSMDFKENFLFTASVFLCKWDLEDTKNPFEMHIKYCPKDAASKVYCLGVHILFVHDRLLSIHKAKDFSTQIVKTVTLLPINEEKAHDHEPDTLAFDLKGKHLVTIIQDGRTNTNITLNIYDLSNNGSNQT